MARESYHHGNLAEALIEAGLSEVAANGPDALGLRALSARIGVSHTAPKNHFGSLRGLRSAVAGRVLSDLARYLIEAVDADAKPKKRLRQLLKAHQAFVARAPNLFFLATAAEVLDPDHPEYRAGADALRAAVDAAAGGHDWAPLGGGKPDRAHSTAMILALMLGHGRLSFMAADTDPPPPLDRLAPQTGGKRKG